MLKTNLPQPAKEEPTLSHLRDTDTKWPLFLRPFSRHYHKSKTVNGAWGLALRRKQNRARIILHNVYGLRVAVTIGEQRTKSSLDRIKSCITSHTGVMGVTSILSSERESICIATQTQALIIGIRKSRKPLKLLITFLKTTNCTWIIDSVWSSPLRELISRGRLVDWRTLG